jgi:hypothetical protein
MFSNFLNFLFVPDIISAFLTMNECQYSCTPAITTVSPYSLSIQLYNHLKSILRMEGVAQW